MDKKRSYRKTDAFRDQVIEVAQQQDDVRERWVEFPGDYSAGVLSMYRTRIREGKMLGLGFDARTKTTGGKTRLWVRYIGNLD